MGVKSCCLMAISQSSNVNPWLIHVNVWQKPLQHCKVISLQLIKIKKKKNNAYTHTIFTRIAGLKGHLQSLNVLKKVIKKKKKSTYGPLSRSQYQQVDFITAIKIKKNACDDAQNAQITRYTNKNYQDSTHPSLTGHHWWAVKEHLVEMALRKSKPPVGLVGWNW